MDIAQQLYNRFRKTKVSNNIWQLYKALELLDLVSRFLEHHKDRYKIKILPLTHISNGGKHRRNPKKITQLTPCWSQNIPKVLIACEPYKIYCPGNPPA